MLKLIQNFKKQSNLWMFGAFLFLLHGATKSLQPAGVIDHFKVGDVIYSMLPYQDFIRLHGTGWMMMDAQGVNASADLRKIFPSVLLNGTNLPDARGRFIRGMSYGGPGSRQDRMNTTDGDPDNQRIVGSFQTDDFKSHTHVLGLRTYNANTQDSGPNQVGVEAILPSGNRTGVGIYPTGGAETRPRNIALYIYVKVDEDGVY
ncbi:hypothetical protein [Runella sp.]|jgi:hypothetical protein|uniref:hypothetical protein n=1 Tax=Runella sp. TaxID=1960881 RepID=UPI002614C3C1|nr:hypothetical protein [Runella sp.]